LTTRRARSGRSLNTGIPESGKNKLDKGLEACNILETFRGLVVWGMPGYPLQRKREMIASCTSHHNKKAHSTGILQLWRNALRNMFTGEMMPNRVRPRAGKSPTTIPGMVKWLCHLDHKICKPCGVKRCLWHQKRLETERGGSCM
jgi:hypothetical protein